MTNSESSQTPAHEGLAQDDVHTYPRHETNATLGCSESIYSLIQESGPLSFYDFMATALYHPDGGYYASKATRVGKDGDFFTSVSVGATFGTILAHRLHQIWENCASPETFHLIELGANDGSLCRDILTTLQALSPETHWHYHIIEPLEDLRNIQVERSAEIAAAETITLEHHDALDELKGLTGVLFSNELIDAFPVDVVRYSDEHGWLQRRVIALEEPVEDEDGETQYFEWADCLIDVEHPENDELMAFFAKLHQQGVQMPDGYITEFRPNIGGFLESAAEAITTGAMLTIDYGFPFSHYYHKTRTEGTLQTYRNHQADDKPLVSPGTRDITAHVDFTQLTELSIKAGWSLHDFSPQHRYLTHHGKNWLLSLEGSPTPESIQQLKQFQTLTHPGMMGQQFHMLEMTRGKITLAPPATEAPEEVLEL